MIRSVGISALVVLATVVSTAEAQIVRIGPFGGTRVWTPGFRLNVPGPPVVPPIFRSPFGLPPMYGPPLPIPSYRYQVRRIPAYEVPTPGFQMDFYGPGGTGSISVGTPSFSTPAVPSTAEPLGQVTYRPADPMDLEAQLYDSASRLTRSLAARRDGDPWMNYLAPNRITAALERGETTGLLELISHYNGVVANPRLAFIANLDGFATTRRLLPQYVAAISRTTPQPATGTPQQPSEESNAAAADSGTSLLPAPVPTPAPEPDADPVAKPGTQPSPPETKASPPPAPQPPPVPQPPAAAKEPSPAQDIQPADGRVDL